MLNFKFKDKFYVIRKISMIWSVFSLAAPYGDFSKLPFLRLF